MYKVFHGNSALKQLFPTYEQARQFTRKRIRKSRGKHHINTVHVEKYGSSFPWNDGRNPRLCNYNYRIRNVS